jgi:hypothetical protein
LPLPDTCAVNIKSQSGLTSHVLDWNPIASAGATSAFVAVLAGFVFAGIVVILSTASGSGSTARNEAANRASRILLAAFFTLAVDAYLYAIASGEQVCLRADTEQVMDGGALGLGAVLILLALSWLLITYNREAAIPFARRMIEYALYFIVLMLVTASTSYLSAALPDDHLTLTVWMMRLTGVGAFGAVWIQFRVRQWSALDEHPVVGAAWNTYTSRAAWAGLILAAVSAVVSGIAMGSSAQVWYPTPHWAVYPVAWASLIFPLAAVFFSVSAVAAVPETAHRREQPQALARNVPNQSGGASGSNQPSKTPPSP